MKPISGCLTFPCFQDLPWLEHGFIIRQDGVDVRTDRSEALKRLKSNHEQALKSFDIEQAQLSLAEQVHGKQVAVLQKAESHPAAGTDGLVTSQKNLPLGIYVADCCAIFLADTQRRAIALLHSGKKGMELNIAREGIARLKESCGADSSQIVAALSPCIHSCCYEVDLVSGIKKQLQDEGVTQIWTHEDCTGCHLDRYYSYRKEKGRTGRMLAFMKIKS